MVPPHILPSSSPIRTYFIKRTSDKKHPILRPNPSYTGLTLRGETGSLGSFPLSSFPLSLSGPGIYLPRLQREGLLPETAIARPGVMEGKMPLFHVPVSLWIQKHCFPTSTSAAQLHFRAKHNTGM